jgi:hypothetical protein
MVSLVLRGKTPIIPHIVVVLWVGWSFDGAVSNGMFVEKTLPRSILCGSG